MSAELTAVLGVGQTKYSATRGDVSIAGLCREAACRALEDAHLGLKNSLSLMQLGHFLYLSHFRFQLMLEPEVISPRLSDST